MFGVSLLNLDSPAQVVKCLNDLGVEVESSDVKELKKHKHNPIVKLLLDYRKYAKFITTYGEPMIDRIHPLTGRLHTRFKQMVDTGRMSSSDPNLQNIPKEQRYRACFVARPGYKLVTCDMSQAELRILAAYSQDPVFLEAFAQGLDLHTRTASDLFGLTYDEVIADKKLDDSDPNKRNYRGNVKALNFGLIYGLTKVGLALRMGTSEKEAQALINMYFGKYTRINTWLKGAAKSAVKNGYSTTRSGRRRYYTLPDPSSSDFNRMRGGIERQGKNHPIQGTNACTIKQSMNYIVDRIKSYDARLLLTVHDEVIVEAKEEQAQEVSVVVSQSMVDGFAEFVPEVKMVADADIENYWVKG